MEEWSYEKWEGRWLSSEDGVTLVTLVILIVLFGLLAIAVVTLVNQNAITTFVEGNNLKALYLAEAGLNDSFWELKYGQKLYGMSSEPLGLIGDRNVTFSDGVEGSYRVPEPTTEILSTGICNGVTRKVRVAIQTNSATFSFYVINDNDLLFEKDVSLTGDAFVNGNLTVTTPSGIDTTLMELYLVSGNSAHYSTGDLFPYTSIAEQPTPPSISNTWYDSLLSEAENQSQGDQTWGDRTISGTTLINGSLVINNHSEVTNGGNEKAIVVVTGSVSMEIGVEIGDNIYFVVGGSIDLSNNVVVGNTTGRSGNLLYTRSGSIAFSNNVIVNGSVVANGSVTFNNNVIINGLLFTNNEIVLGNKGFDLYGECWVGEFSSNTVTRDTDIIFSPDYIPVEMPPGVSAPEMSAGIEIVENSWREVR